MKEEILQLIADKLSDELDDNGNQLFLDWLNESEQNKRAYRAYEQLFSEIRNLKNQDVFVDEKHHFSVVKDKILKKHRRHVLIHRVVYSAAAILLPVLIFTAVFFTSNNSDLESTAMAEIIDPGVKKARLLLSNGEQIELSDSSFTFSHVQEGVEITNTNHQLNYSSIEDRKSRLQYNSLIVGRGEEYQLTLADGTQVWLNSESTLRYPVRFTGKIREVELEGEAFFKVAHKAQKAFVVNTREMEIEVLGTTFNVSAYADDEAVHATLVEGSVKVHNKQGKVCEKILQPNQQFYFEKANCRASINQVNANFYGAWKEGAFTFMDEPLSSIMKKLERWYNVKVFFQGQEVQNLRFSGKLRRFDSCNEVLDVIRKTTHMDYEISGERNIIIR